MLTEHFSGDPEDMAALYRGEHGFTECRGNPLSEERIEALTREHEREIVCRDREHFKSMVREFDRLLGLGARRPANDNRGRVR